MDNLTIGAIGASLGASYPLTADKALSVDRKTLLFLQMMGYEHYRQSELSLADLAALSLQESIRKSGIPADEFDVVVYATATFGQQQSAQIDREFAQCMLRCGLQHAYPVGVFLTQCNGFFTALNVASGLIRDGSAKNVLLVLVDKIEGSDQRFKNLTVYSDGAASCVVSGDPRYHGQFVLRGVQCHARVVDTDLIDSETMKFDVDNQKAYFNGIRTVASRLEEKTGTPLAQCEQLICPNYTTSALKQISDVLAYPYAQIFRNNVAVVGHAHSCDSLLNLESYRLARQDGGNGLVTVLGTGLYFWGATQLECLSERT
jgi:3-oxoacyl-[acyl-carrier-protein] synthase III